MNSAVPNAGLSKFLCRILGGEGGSKAKPCHHFPASTLTTKSLEPMVKTLVAPVRNFDTWKRKGTVAHQKVKDALAHRKGRSKWQHKCLQ